MGKNKDFLIRLRNIIPFLKQIPDNIFFNLDIAELFLPEKDITSAREELEEKLNHHVMTYNKNIFNLDIPAEKHLCAHLKPAKLTKNQLKILELFENRFISKNVNFIVYEKPLSLIPVSKSAIYKLQVSKRRNHRIEPFEYQKYAMQYNEKPERCQSDHRSENHPEQSNSRQLGDV